LGKRTIYKAENGKLECINTHQAAKMRKRVISPLGELTQASYISLERDSTSEVGLDVILLAQGSSFSLERESTLAYEN